VPVIAPAPAPAAPTDAEAGSTPKSEGESLATRSDPTGARAPTRYGTIDLFVDPWAEVWLGNRKMGDAPVKGLRLPLGRHRLRLVNPLQGRETALTVDVPGTHPYRATLSPKRWGEEGSQPAAPASASGARPR
jgi:serine/threonine-protein kinase